MEKNPYDTADKISWKDGSPISDTVLYRYLKGAKFLKTRDIHRLPTTTFSLVLRKEYFDCPQRDSHEVQYMVGRGGGGG